MSFTFRRSYRGPLQAVILDWAGTTIDYGSQAPAMVFVEVFKQQGVTISLDEARGPMGTAKKEHIRQLTQTEAIAFRWQAAHDRLPTEADVEAMYEAFIPRQLEALAHHATLIPGTLEAVADFRRRGLKVGSNTGYNRAMLDIILAEAKKQGYEPDSAVCADDVPVGRPAPWMALRTAMAMNVYPMDAVVKIDDTVPGLEAGLNAGMWTIGVTKTGNELGLSQAEVEALEAETLQAKLDQAAQRMVQAGTHYVVESIAQVPTVLDEITARLRWGQSATA